MVAEESLELTVGGKGRGVFVDMTRHALGLSAKSHRQRKVP